MTSVPSSPSSSPPSHWWLSRVFARQAWLTLFTLLVLLGSSLGLLRASWQLAHPAAAAGGSRGVEVKAGGGCAQIAVQVASGATVQELRRLLRALDTAIVFGPDENDAFQLRAPAGSVDAVLAALENAQLVLSAERRPGCP